ncbi:major facilitator superfamily transporter phosphate [Niveomyces insectorum RCEF 264]|uniref:Major facilitator superfamily transporter phosphate n=1 Tax=Niveomyces insectorum RCEF 264 TaxID=1081102 RepID=A0A167WYX8_9HYPO|nr:major facilitator superfamily transporter phosphate [Niveomyces insectorum RCEF 264]
MSNLIQHQAVHPAAFGVIPVPHGPETGEETETYPVGPEGIYTEEQEREIFRYITHPDDSFDDNGTYWADLPLTQRISFVNQVNNAEAAAELKATWSLFKRDPLGPVSWYFRNAVLPGAGLGLEGYVLFSIGNLSPLFSSAWPSCWGSGATVCNKNWIAAVTYLEVIGIMFGQVSVGVIGDWIGRRWGLIQDAAIMFVGLLMLTASWGLTLQGWVICYAWSLFFYSYGVGGEYPMTATSSMEGAVGAGRLSTRDDRLHRGRKVTMAFLMQGWGQLANQGLLIILLLIFHHGDGDPPYSLSAVQWTYRLSFAFPAVGTLWLVYYRAYKMTNASRQLQIAKKRSNVTGYDVTSLKLIFNHFGGRLLATAGTWFCNDVFFYGNKLFQGQFINVISDNPKSVMVTWVWNICNCIVSLAGYYLASFLIDNKLYGRKMMMQIGFLMCFIMFVVPAFHYKYYSGASGIHAFQAMYFISSFFNQFGPNAVTFLVAGEVFPTPVRATAHGFSACIGKAGALLASVLYNYIDTQTKFYVVPWFGLAGMLLTLVFLPDTTGLDLKEQERRWNYVKNGRDSEYHGIAVHPTHLSLWERMRGVGKYYNPDLDQKAKIRDLRADWEAREDAKRDAEVAGGKHVDMDDGGLTDEAHRFFLHTSPNSPYLASQNGKPKGVLEDLLPGPSSEKDGEKDASASSS